MSSRVAASFCKICAVDFLRYASCKICRVGRVPYAGSGTVYGTVCATLAHTCDILQKVRERDRSSVGDVATPYKI